MRVSAAEDYVAGGWFRAEGLRRSGCYWTAATVQANTDLVEELFLWGAVDDPDEWLRARRRRYLAAWGVLGEACWEDQDGDSRSEPVNAGVGPAPPSWLRGSLNIPHWELILMLWLATLAGVLYGWHSS